MHRTGLEESELPEVMDLVKKNNRYLQLEGICTHFAGAESIANFLRIQNQFHLFERLKKDMKRRGLSLSFIIGQLAAALIYPQPIMDMVIFGKAQYGFWPIMRPR